MVVIQVPFCYYPDPVGGTEIYVERLARELQTRGVEVLVAAPGLEEGMSLRPECRVRRFAMAGEVSDLRELYGDGDAMAGRRFGGLLDEERADVVHLHAFTRGVSLRLVREAHRRRMPVVFTYHTPTVSCVRGTLMRWGEYPCDGVLERRKCCSCALHKVGMNRLGARAVGSLPPSVGRIIGRAALRGRVWTTLRMPELVELRHEAFRSLVDEVDRVVVLCQWTAELLERNGVAAGKVVLCPHGVAGEARPGNPPPTSMPRQGGIVRMAFMGRSDRAKGVDVLVRAVRLLRNAPLELHLHLIAREGAGSAYLSELKHLAGGDGRIVFHEPVGNGRATEVLRDSDILGVPSRLLETGPLVVLEAFAAGLPVMGSRLGGVAELVRHEVDGLLVEPDSVEAWRRGLLRLIREPGLLARLRSGVRPPRSVSAVADEMLRLYGTLLEDKATASGTRSGWASSAARFA